MRHFHAVESENERAALSYLWEEEKEEVWTLQSHTPFIIVSHHETVVHPLSLPPSLPPNNRQKRSKLQAIRRLFKRPPTHHCRAVLLCAMAPSYFPYWREAGIHTHTQTDRHTWKKRIDKCQPRAGNSSPFFLSLSTTKRRYQRLLLLTADVLLSCRRL